MNDNLDLNVSGASSMPGGTYRTVRISGSGKIQGNLKAETVSCSGASRVCGTLEAQKLTCSGACKMEGTLIAEEAHISGSFKAEQDVSGQDLKISGAAKISGSLKARMLRQSGAMRVEQDLEAEEASLNGCVKIGGLANVGVLSIRSEPTSEIAEIGCSSIVVRRCSGGLWSRLLKKQNLALKAGTIEADSADLEFTAADTIRCVNLRLGPGCHIRRAEYSGTCDVPEGAVDTLIQSNL